MVVCFGYALPFSRNLEHKQIVGKVDALSPLLFEHAHRGNRFFECQHVDPCLEVFASPYAVYIVIKLLDGTVFQFSVQETVQYGFIDKQLFGIQVVTVGYAFDEFRCGFFYGIVL